MTKYRNGSWVMTDQGVGIWIGERVAVSADGSRRLVGGSYRPAKDESIEVEAWIHLTNGDGSTLTQLPAARCTNIRHAKRAEIPASRIEHLNDKQLAGFGYV